MVLLAGSYGFDRSFVSPKALGNFFFDDIRVPYGIFYGWFTAKDPIETDDLVVPLVQETSVSFAVDETPLLGNIWEEKQHLLVEIEVARHRAPFF